MLGGARRLAQEAAVELSLKKLDSFARVLYFLIDTLRAPHPESDTASETTRLNRTYGTKTRCLRHQWSRWINLSLAAANACT